MVAEMIESSQVESRKRFQSQIDVLTVKLGVLERATPEDSRITATTGEPSASDGGGPDAMKLEDESDEVDAANAARDREIAFDQLSEGFLALKKDCAIKFRRLKDQVDKLSSFMDKVGPSIVALDGRVAVSGRLILEATQQQKARMDEMELRLQRADEEVGTCMEELRSDMVELRSEMVEDRMRVEATYATRLEIHRVGKDSSQSLGGGHRIGVVNLQQSSPPLPTSPDPHTTDIELASIPQRLDSLDNRLNNLEMISEEPVSATLALNSASIINVQQRLDILESNIATIIKDQLPGDVSPTTPPRRHPNHSSFRKSPIRIRIWFRLNGLSRSKLR